MSEWQTLQISDLGQVITGKTPSSKNPKDFGDDILFITPSDYNGYVKYLNKAERKLSAVGSSNLKNKILPIDSVMVTCIGSDMGKVAVNLQPVITNQQINSIIPNKKVVIPDFLYYALVNEYDTLRVYGQEGTAVPIVNKTTFESIKVAVPPLVEQGVISEVLSSLDDKIELLVRNNKTLEQLAEILFRQWFIEEASESWEEMTLSSQLQFKYGKSLREDNRSGDGFPVFGSGGLAGYHNEYLVKGPGVIIGRKGTIGTVTYVFDNFFPIDTTFYITSNRATVNYLYEYHLLKTLGLKEMNSDSAVPGLNRDAAMSLKTLLPPEDLMKSYEDICSPLFDKIRKNRSQIHCLESIRDTLLPKLLSGEIRLNKLTESPKNMSIQPAT